MALPRVDQYQLALQNPRVSFRDPDLKAASVETNPMGLPKVISGGFALTYHLSNGGQQWAVRCFHKDAPDLEKRYAAISALTGSAISPYLISVEYEPGGILVDGSWHPMTKMPWLNAMPINRYIETNLSPAVAQRLAKGFQGLVADMAKLGVAHGDLQHGNILVDAAGNLKLVDYDGLFVPALRGMKANESGHPNYQHPLRKTQFDPDMDRFSILAVTVSLEALATKPDLWKKYSNGDNLLFKQSDFADPTTSPLFSDLISLPAIRANAERLRSIALGRYEDIPTLDNFEAGTFRVTPRPIAVTPQPVRPQFDMFASSATGQLIGREGYIVTVVGQITAIRTALTRYSQPYAFLNFGNYQAGCFTLVLWKEAIELFAKLGSSPQAFDGQWVSVTGLITVYRPRGNRAAQPQMVANMPSEIQIISAGQAKDILGGKVTAPSPTKIIQPTTNGAAIKKDTADTLNRIYRNFPSVPAPTPSTPARPPTPTPRQPVPRQPVPAGRGQRQAPRKKRDYSGLVWALIILAVIAYFVWKATQGS